MAKRLLKMETSVCRLGSCWLGVRRARERERERERKKSSRKRERRGERCNNVEQGSNLRTSKTFLAKGMLLHFSASLKKSLGRNACIVFTF